MTIASHDSLGQLLVNLGWISDQQRQKAVAIAQETDQPVGRVLASQGYISEKEIRPVVEAQSMLRDGYITAGEAMRALTISSWSGMSLENALLISARALDDDRCDNRLGQLLYASGYLDEVQIEQSLEASLSAGLQLGRMLLVRKLVNQALLSAALEAQKLIRAGLISFDQATIGLATMKNCFNEQEESDSENMFLPLGRLLVQAGILVEQQLSEALDRSRIDLRPLGQTLLFYGYVPEHIVQTALDLQQLMRSNKLLARCALKALALVFNQNLSIQQALASANDRPGAAADISVATFLKRTGLFSGNFSEIEKLPNREQMRILSSSIGETHLRMALRCTFLVRHSILAVEQALVGFHYSWLTNADIDEFLADAGWVTPEALGMIGQQQSERHLKAVA